MYVWIHVYVLRFCSFFFFFCFFTYFGEIRLLFIDFSTVNSISVYCLWTYKFHFLTIFSLKMGHTALFTHLKIILLQYFQFSVFSFQFQQNKFYLNITLISRNHWQWNKFYTDVDIYASNINPLHQIFATKKSRNCCTKSHFHSNTLNLILFTFTRLLRKQCVKPILRN